MAIIKPLRGYIYNTRKIKNIGAVLAPPYDVISPAMQDELYKKDKYNIVRLILGKDEPSDTKSNNKYTRAKLFLDAFIKDGMLARDDKPAIYVYSQEYAVPEGKKNRIGFIALMKLEDREGNKVLPHERTFKNPKTDRLRLIRQVNANLSPIFSLFEDKDNKVTAILERETKEDPVFDVLFEDVRERLWRISDAAVIADIQAAMADKHIFIADGHHRFEVAMAFRDEMRLKTKSTSTEEPYDYVMMYFASLDDDRLTIMPTHRIIRDCSLTKEKALELLEKHFKVGKFNDFKAMLSAQENVKAGYAFGAYFGGSDYYLLNLEDISDINRFIKLDRSINWKKLDVSILHNFVLKRILKIKETDGNISYLRDADLAAEKVGSGEYKLALFLNPTKLEQVRNIAQAGEKMPHKSTYFYPKLLSGVVVNKFDIKEQ